MSKLPLSKQNFEHLDIPNLLINIWSYNDDSHRNCSVCKQHGRWCIEVAKKKKKKWFPSFIDFDFVIQNLKRQKKIFGFDFGKVCSADRNKIFVVISKFKTL